MRFVKFIFSEMRLRMECNLFREAMTVKDKKIEEVDDGDEKGDFAHIMMTISMSLKIAIFTLQRG